MRQEWTGSGQFILELVIAIRQLAEWQSQTLHYRRAWFAIAAFVPHSQ